MIILGPKSDPLLSSSMRQASCKCETPRLELKSSQTFLAIKRWKGTKIGKVIKQSRNHEAQFISWRICATIVGVFLLTVTAYHYGFGWEQKTPAPYDVSYSSNSTKSTIDNQHSSPTNINGEPFALPTAWDLYGSTRSNAGNLFQRGRPRAL
jgi:hypothetical protein